MILRRRCAPFVTVLLLAGCQATVPMRPGIEPVAAPRPDRAPVTAPAPPTEPAAATTPAERVAGASDAHPAEGDDASAVVAAPVDVERTGVEVFDRLRSRLDTDRCADDANRNPWRRQFLRRPEALSRQLAQALPLLDFVERRIAEEGLPAEFALVPLIESGYRADARSPGAPAGLWQLIPSTARNHGVRFAPGFDGRFSPLDSTRAALSYLKVLQPEFGSWQAMAMAYNAGENRMRRALKRYGPTVSALDQRPRSLSPVTYHYVAKLEAIACLIAAPPDSLRLPGEATFAPLEVARIPDGMATLDELAAATGQSNSELLRYNPGFRRKLIPAGAPRDVLLPADAMARLTGLATQSVAAAVPAASVRAAVAENAAIAEPAPAATVHRVQPGDTLWAIARRYGMGLAALLRLNGLRADAVLRPGQSLRLSP